jgi:two-component system, OmpR family, KDP operon response regulator KdpE
MSTDRPALLLVEDEPRLLRALTINLQARHYAVHPVATGRAALDVAVQHLPDLVVLDLGLPDLDGMDVIRGLRGWTAAPILVLSGRTDSSDKVDALDAGADDYVTKPFGMEELLARLRALTRRSTTDTEEPIIHLGDTVVDLATRRVQRDHRDVRLTPTEWKLLEVLLRHPGILLSQHRLLSDVWGPGYETAQGNLRLYMGQLRRKLEADPARPRHLLNEPGLGYRFQP